MSQTKMYAIPDRFRKIENLHIVFWLLKDLGWAMLWRPLGIAMIVPTMAVAILITWQTRKIKAELFHNLAIVSWISANAYWMISEFFKWPDETRYYAAIPFSIGILFIGIYYFVILPNEKKTEKMVTIEVEVSESMLKAGGEK
ncbi:MULTISPECIES: hypothetical protein [unclassified Paraflavitalea]|uniref:hypothetical protein n=1 Tax=unclassified Paraflavitalea TaxID=2798305 RepID=UPI003D34BF46